MGQFFFRIHITISVIFFCGLNFVDLFADELNYNYYKNSDTIDKNLDTTFHSNLWFNRISKYVQLCVYLIISFWWWQTTVNYIKYMKPNNASAKVLLNGKKSTNTHTHTHTPTTHWNWFKRHRFSTTYIWMTSFSFHTLAALGKPINHSFFLALILMALEEISLSSRCNCFIAIFIHFQATFMSQTFFEMSNSYSYLRQILMRCFYLASSFFHWFFPTQISSTKERSFIICFISKFIEIMAVWTLNRSKKNSLFKFPPLFPPVLVDFFFFSNHFKTLWTNVGRQYFNYENFRRDTGVRFILISLFFVF